MSDTYCVQPFIGMYCETDGSLSPCCRYDPRQHATKRQHQPMFDIREIDAWWEDLDLVRDQLCSGIKSPGCHRCWNDEANGVESYRQQSNQTFKKIHAKGQEKLPHPVTQMWALTNVCNLRCSFCSPNKSSTVHASWHKNKEIYFKYFDEQWQNIPSRSSLDTNDLDTVVGVMRHARDINLTGGEPMMVPEYYKALNQIDEPGIVDLRITTNGTMVTDEWITLLKKFQRTTVSISLEGIGAYNDYIRPPSRWQDIETGVDKLRQANIDVIITTVWNRFSINALPGLLAWCCSRHLRIYLQNLYRPEALLISGSSARERAILKDKITQLADQNPSYYYEPNIVRGLWTRLDNLMDTEYDSDVDEKFTRYIQGLDLLNGMDYAKIVDDAQH